MAITAPAGFAPLTGNTTTAQIPGAPAPTTQTQKVASVTPPGYTTTNGNTILTSPNKSTQPSVLSSTSIDTKNQDNMSTITGKGATGQVVGADGVARNADGTPASAPSGTSLFTDTEGNQYYSNGSIKYATPTQVSDDPFTQQIYDQLTSLKGQMDATGAAQIGNIEAQYQSLITSQQATNKSQEAGTYSLLARGGSLQTASSGGIMQSQISQGIQKISDLVTQENTATLAARQAMENNDMQMLDKQLTIAADAQKQRQAAAQRISDNIITAQKAITDQNTATDNQIKSLMADAAKNGALTADQNKAIQSALATHDYSGAVSALGDSLQTATGTLGDYLQYKRDAVSKGLVPTDYQSYKDAQDAKDARLKAQASYNDAYNSAAGTAAANASSGVSNKVQQGLEQQYRQILAKEFSARTGSLGIENSKVNQGNHLNAMFTQYYDPKTGNYNIPTAQYAELAIGLANMISPQGNSSDSDRAEIKSKTAAGDLKGALQYITGEPQNGNTQAIIKNLVDSVDRQAETATRNREAALTDMKALAPTDLDPARVDALNKATVMVPYEGQDRISKSSVNAYVKANPAEAADIAKMYAIPGATDQDVEAYLKAQGKIQ